MGDDDCRRSGTNCPPECLPRMDKSGLYTLGITQSGSVALRISSSYTDNEKMVAATLTAGMVSTLSAMPMRRTVELAMEYYKECLKKLRQS